MKVVGINGSHNSDGNVAFLINTVLADLEAKGFETEIISAHEAIEGCKTPFCVSCSSPCSKACYGSELTYLFDAITKADAVIFGSPVYFGSMSGQLKCLFDKTRDLRANKALFGKPGLAVSCGASKYGGQETTVRAIQDCMLVNGMSIIGPSSSLGAGHQGICAQKPASEDNFAIERAHLAAQRIYEELTK